MAEPELKDTETVAKKPPPVGYNRYFADHLRLKKAKAENQPEFAVITYEHPAYRRPQ